MSDYKQNVNGIVCIFIHRISLFREVNYLVFFDCLLDYVNERRKIASPTWGGRQAKARCDKTES